MSYSANQFPLFPNETGGTLPASTDLHCENGHESLDLANTHAAVCFDDSF
jgi:hypothetical protein